MSTYIQSKIDDLNYCKTNGQFTRHLKAHNLSYKDYYEKYVTGKTELCQCGKSKTFYQNTETYANSCGDPICVGAIIKEVKSQWSAEKREQDSRNKRIAFSQLTELQINEKTKKAKETYNQRYDSTWSNSASQKNKSKHTKLNNHGNEFYSNWEKSANTNRTKTLLEKRQISEKRRGTNLVRFGVENCFMRPDIIKQARKGNALGKEYILPSGKVIGVRGYENIVLDKLFEIYKEDQIKVDNRKEKYNLPKFEYITVQRQHYKYYPDIYVPSENLIIEVKSQWWWDGNGAEKYKGRLENNNRKAKAVIDAGYNYQLWLFSNNISYEIIIWQQ